MNVLEISVNSEAGRYIANAMADPYTYKISIAPHSENEIKVKRNENMWTYQMSTVPDIRMSDVKITHAGSITDNGITRV